MLGWGGGEGGREGGNLAKGSWFFLLRWWAILSSFLIFLVFRATVELNGCPLTLMHFQSRTCNRPVDEAVQVVSLREPFHRVTSQLQNVYVPVMTRKKKLQGTISAFSGTSPSGMYIIKVIFKVISFFQWAWRIFIFAATIKSSDLNLLLPPHFLHCWDLENTSDTKVSSLLTSLTLGVQCLGVFFRRGVFYFQPLAVSEQMEHGQSGGKRWKYIWTL